MNVAPRWPSRSAIGAARPAFSTATSALGIVPASYPTNASTLARSHSAPSDSKTFAARRPDSIPSENSAKLRWWIVSMWRMSARARSSPIASAS